MIFHLGFELPERPSTELDHESAHLTREEIRILKKQIRSNSMIVDQHVSRLELFVNKERYPHREVFLEKIRRRMELLMAENDTFRKVLWKHYQKEEIMTQ